MLRVGVIGARGYTGAELVRLLCKHPDVELTYLTSESQQGIDQRLPQPARAYRPGVRGVDVRPPARRSISSTRCLQARR